MKITLSKEKFLKMLTNSISKINMDGVTIKNAKVVDFYVNNEDWDTVIELEVREDDGGW